MSAKWPQEDIPDGDILYMRAHKHNVKDGQLMPAAIKDHGDGMSVNWQKYCATPEQARALARNPKDNGVVQFVTGDVRSIDTLSVEHTPDEAANDRSHTDIKGEKTTEVRSRLSRYCQWCIKPGE